MANWKKVIVSGSSAQLSQLSVDTSVNITGSLNASGSVNFPALTNLSQANIVSYDTATGQLYYQGTGSFSASSASFANTASYINPLTQSVSIDGPVYVTGSGVNQGIYTDNIFPGSGNAGNRIYMQNTNSSAYSNVGDLVVYSSGGNVDLVALGNAVRITGGGAPTDGVQITGSLKLQGGATGSFTGSFNGTGSIDGYFTGNAGLTGSFTGSFAGDGSGLNNISASSIVGLNLSQISSGSATASISPDSGLQINVSTTITGSLVVSGSVGSSFDINADTFIFTGSLSTSGSVSFRLNEQSSSYLVGYDPTTGNLYYEGTGSVVSMTASYANEAGKVTNVLTASAGGGLTAFTYDGSAPAQVEISGAAFLLNNNLTKWNAISDIFVSSSITDDSISGTVINNALGVTIQTGGLYVTGASTFHDDVVMQGNLTVNGTASFQNVENLAVKDQFILLNSGSTTFQDSGIVINTGNSANSGSAFFLETANTTNGTDALNGRFAVGSGILPDATTATAAEYANTTLITGSAPVDGVSIPQWGGTLNGQGNTWVDTATGDIYIYA